jgi:hypothetical protein
MVAGPRKRLAELAGDEGGARFDPAADLLI